MFEVRPDARGRNGRAHARAKRAGSGTAGPCVRRRRDGEDAFGRSATRLSGSPTASPLSRAVTAADSPSRSTEVQSFLEWLLTTRSETRVDNPLDEKERWLLLPAPSPGFALAVRLIAGLFAAAFAAGFAGDWQPASPPLRMSPGAQTGVGGAVGRRRLSPRATEAARGRRQGQPVGLAWVSCCTGSDVRSLSVPARHRRRCRGCGIAATLMPRPGRTDDARRLARVGGSGPPGRRCRLLGSASTCHPRLRL